MIDALGSTLLQFLWQGALIAAIYAIGRTRLHRSGPDMRYALACIALTALVAAPLLTLSLHHASNPPTSDTAQAPAAETSQITKDPAKLSDIVLTNPPHAYLQWVVMFWLI